MKACNQSYGAAFTLKQGKAQPLGLCVEEKRILYLKMLVSVINLIEINLLLSPRPYRE